MPLGSLEQHDIALAKLIDASSRAAAALRGRIEDAEAALTRFGDSFSEEEMAAALAAQKTLDGLKKIQAEMPDPAVRGVEVRERYVHEHKVELIELIRRDLAGRVKALAGRREAIAADITKPGGVSVPDELNARTAQAEQSCLAANGAAQLFRNEPNFANFSRARALIGQLGSL